MKIAKTTAGLLATFALLWALGCGGGGGRKGGDEIVVAAAANLTDAFGEMGRRFTAAPGGRRGGVEHGQRASEGCAAKGAGGHAVPEWATTPHAHQ